MAVRGRRTDVRIGMMRLAAIVAMAVAGDVRALLAQHPAGWSPGPSDTRPRVGHAAPAAPVAQPPQPRQQAGPIYVVAPVYYYDAYGQLTGAPYVVLADGSVLVNFGGGYERVLRSCSQFQPATPRDPWERDALGRIPDPPGIAAMRAGTRGTAIGVAPALNTAACYRHDRDRLEVVLP